MNKSTSWKVRFWQNIDKNPIGGFILSFVKYPINILYAGLGIVVFMFSYQSSFSEKPVEPGYFAGKIVFDDENYHRIETKNIEAQVKNEMGNPVLTLTCTQENSLESVYLKIFKVKGPGTYFIPGDGEISNIGNLIKNLDNYQDKNNFFESSLPNKEGVKNGVGRVNITKITSNYIEGELILIANNPKGQQAVLESAKFKVALQN
ncbi:hypothetical protein [Aquirufa sp. OSTEICH-129A]